MARLICHCQTNRNIGGLAQQFFLWYDTDSTEGLVLRALSVNPSFGMTKILKDTCVFVTHTSFLVIWYVSFWQNSYQCIHTAIVSELMRIKMVGISTDLLNLNRQVAADG